MQTIYLDISNKGVVPTVYAKQGDVGRRFLVVLTDSGIPYSPPAGSVFSVWYEGDSGEGNYTDIGEQSAFSINENAVTVEMIEQMLSVAGNGILCLTLNKADGGQIGSWNIPYVCERIPGFESEEATSYYTAFSETVKNLQKMVETDPTVPNWAKAPQKPVYTASEVGARPNTWTPTASDVGAAPAGYGLGVAMSNDYTVADCNNALECGWYVIRGAANTPNGASYGILEVSARDGENLKVQTIKSATSDGSVMICYRVYSSGWQPWEWENPLMTLGVEYRTTERYKGKAVYTKLINFGYLPNATKGGIAIDVDATLVLRCKGVMSNGYTLPYVYGDTRIELCAEKNRILITTNKDYSTGTADIQIWYTKD